MILLETLPGWPAAPEFSWMHLLWLTVFAPVLFSAIVTAILLAPSYFRKSRTAEVAVTTD